MRQPPFLRRAERPCRVDPRLRPAQLADLAIDHAELIRRSYRAFEEEDLESLLRQYHPDAIWDFSHWEGFPDQPVYRGLEGVERVARIFIEFIGLVKNKPTEIVDLDEERVFVAGRTTVRGASSGAQVDVPPFGQIIEFRDGLISRVDNYSDVDEARRAAGLPEG